MRESEETLIRIGVEIGGTFTDFIVLNGGQVGTLKVPSTPANPALAVLAGLAELRLDLAGVSVIIHGSTIATNATLERKGAPTGFVATDGFGDILEFQRELKRRNYDIRYQKPQPLVGRDRVFELAERVDAAGAVVRPLQEDGLRDRLERFLAEHRLTSLAVCLLHAYKNPAHERHLQEIVEDQFPGVHVVLSSSILPEFREYERASTTVLSAYVAPVVDRYLATLEKGLADMAFRGDFHIMQSNGGILPAASARAHGVRTILSGPAAGVVGATRVAAAAGIADVITLDMGGTSTDVCLVNDARPAVTTEAELDGLPIRVPMIDIVTVGAGGGSLARLDAGKMLRVGPESAGADPGPACYGKGGTEPTVTDAYVVKGLIRPDRFLGGKMPLDEGAAWASMEQLAGGLGFTPLEMADAVYRIATANMAQAIRLVSVERGYDPRDYTLVTFGGAGGLHAAYFAEELNTRGALIPPSPGLLSAYGLLVSDFQRDYVQTDIVRFSRATPDRVLGVAVELRRRALDELRSYRIDPNSLTYEWSVDVRYAGQAYELGVLLDPAAVELGDLQHIAERFHALHHRRYGHASPEKETEIVNYRLIVTKPADVQLLGGAAPERPTPIAEAGTVCLEGKEMACVFYARASLPPGCDLVGPAVVEEDTATTLIPPGWQGRVDGRCNILLSEVTG